MGDEMSMHPVLKRNEDRLTFLSLNDVVKRTTLSRSTILVMVREGRFPQPVRLGYSRTAYVEAEVVEWMEEAIRATREGGAPKEERLWAVGGGQQAA
jgi:prophage regulatory protein